VAATKFTALLYSLKLSRSNILKFVVRFDTCKWSFNLYVAVGQKSSITGGNITVSMARSHFFHVQLKFFDIYIFKLRINSALLNFSSENRAAHENKTTQANLTSLHLALAYQFPVLPKENLRWHGLSTFGPNPLPHGGRPFWPITSLQANFSKSA
jgi:hypothetical protein